MEISPRFFTTSKLFTGPRYGPREVIMTTHSITVTIGRNAPVTDPTRPQYDDVTGARITEPMSDQRWREFDMDAQGTLANNVFERQIIAIERHLGRGSWEGVEEDSLKITYLLKSALTDEAVATLSRELSELARLYDQDAIALTIGTSTLC